MRGWFDPEVNWGVAPTGKRGRQPTYSDASVQKCLTMKVLFGMAPGQTTGFVESLLRLAGLDWDVPDFSTICRRQRTLAANIPYRGSKGPLHLLIPSRRCKQRLPGSGQHRHQGRRGRRMERTHPSHRNFVSTAGQWAAPNNVSGARFISALMNRHWTSERSRSRVATRVMHRCCLICSIRFRAIRRLAA